MEGGGKSRLNAPTSISVTLYVIHVTERSEGTITPRKERGKGKGTIGDRIGE